MPSMPTAAANSHNGTRCLILTFVCMLTVVGCLLLNVAFPGGGSHGIAIVNTPPTPPAPPAARPQQPQTHPQQQVQQSQQVQQVQQAHKHPQQQQLQPQQLQQQQQLPHQVASRKQKTQPPYGPKYILLAAPEYKLLWCSVAKVGSSSAGVTINTLRASLPGTPPDVQHFLRTGSLSDRLQALMPHDASQRTLRSFAKFWGRSRVGSPAVNVTAEDVTTLLADDSWTKVLFVRDPVERFLSAFASKCQPGHDPVGMCVLANKTHPYISFATFMQRARARFANPRLGKGLFSNYHWSPQARFCGGLTPDRNLPHYNAVYRYSSSTFGADTADALLRAGVERSQVEAVLAQTLKGGGWKRAGGASHVTGAGGKLCRYFTSVEEVQEVAGWYREDYEAFGEVLAQQPSAVERYKEMCGQKVL